MKNQFLKKLLNPSLKEVISYCDKIAQIVENDVRLNVRDNINKRLNYLKEGLTDTEVALEEISDCEARVGNKSADDPFLRI